MKPARRHKTLPCREGALEYPRRRPLLRALAPALYFQVSPGNNHQLVRRVLALRPHWQEATAPAPHFLWRMSPVPLYRRPGQKKTLSNHLDNSHLLSNKALLFTNMLDLSRKLGFEVEEHLPKTFVLAAGPEGRAQLQQFF
jgi:hypothetical protein